MAEIKGTTPKALAEELEMDERSLRRILRKMAKDAGVKTPGSGGNWDLSAETCDAIRNRAKGERARIVRF